MPDVASSEAVYALLIDGTPVRIRALGPGDLGADRDPHRGMSPDNLYPRSFGYGSRIADEVAAHLCQEPGTPGPPSACGSAATSSASPSTTRPTRRASRRSPSPSPTTCTAAAPAHSLLEHLVSLARERGIREFRAETLMQNVTMLRVFSSAGPPVRRRRAGRDVRGRGGRPRAGAATAALGSVPAPPSLTSSRRDMCRRARSTGHPSVAAWPYTVDDDGTE